MKDEQIVVGVDGCRAGWFAVQILGNSKISYDIFPNAEQLWSAHHSAQLILIDIPIGLREEGKHERFCDKEAREKLKPKRASSVFPAPCRQAVYYTEYSQASELNKKITGKGLSKQVWNIIPKIREVDQLLSSDAIARSKIREVHPEICFWALNGCKPMDSGKATSKGVSERLILLEKYFSRVHDLTSMVYTKFKHNQVKMDDVLDALCAAVTATNDSSRLAIIPESPERDTKGLPMEMVYAKPLLSPPL